MNVEEKIKNAEDLFRHYYLANVWFAQGDMEMKRAIFACLGSNHILHLQKVSLTLNKPFNSIFEKKKEAEEEFERFESLKIPTNTNTIKEIASKFPVMSG